MSTFYDRLMTKKNLPRVPVPKPSVVHKVKVKTKHRKRKHKGEVEDLYDY
jgi:hypothetical protein